MDLYLLCGEGAWGFGLLCPRPPLRSLSGGTTLQPSDDFVGPRIPGRDLLHHRNVRIRIFPRERATVGFKEQPYGEESGSLVAVRQRVVACQMLDQDRRFLYERRIRVLIAEACLRCGEGGSGKANPRQTGDLRRSRAEQSSGDFAVIAKLQISSTATWPGDAKSRD